MEVFLLVGLAGVALLVGWLWSEVRGLRTDIQRVMLETPPSEEPRDKMRLLAPVDRTIKTLRRVR